MRLSRILITRFAMPVLFFTSLNAFSQVENSKLITGCWKVVEVHYDDPTDQTEKWKERLNAELCFSDSGVYYSPDEKDSEDTYKVWQISDSGSTIFLSNPDVIDSFARFKISMLTEKKLVLEQDKNRTVYQKVSR
ncbi:lipocalin family protein [Flavobacterium silvaticum]|uniref:Lipocalin-like domain-containing protein n=1 Tax=Flavobacterium silvaticum TaxID=1852020 RepID=A0A972FTV4_9FLAO|nr:lipocalin family protein [Flavobacterium silvaticum]NMH29224.1 hypothetical protein [Flavobacterium silvaticum]